MPPGGFTATQPVEPTITPADIAQIVEQLTPIQQRFRKASSPLSVSLPQVSFSALGQQAPTRISSVGLGTRIVSHWHLEITVANSDAAAETFDVSPLFPYNVVANTTVQINGGATVYSAGGLGTLAAMTRQRRGSRRLSNAGGFGPALDPSLVRVSLGSELTATNAGNADKYLSGIKSVSVAASASSNNVITVDFYTVEKLCLDRDSLLGALPLQNGSTYANLVRQIVGALSGTRNDLSMPFYTAGSSLTFSLTKCTVDSTYEFWSVPSDPSLYQAMIANSYQVQEQTAINTASTGAGAFVYNLPQNIYLLAASMYTVDSSGIALPFADLDPIKIVYNAGSIVPVAQYQGRQRASQYLSYDADPDNIAGLRFWDGEDTSDDINATDDAGWLDTYSAASPQIVADVASGASTALTTNITREQVVAGAVQSIGG